MLGPPAAAAAAVEATAAAVVDEAAAKQQDGGQSAEAAAELQASRQAEEQKRIELEIVNQRLEQDMLALRNEYTAAADGYAVLGVAAFCLDAHRC